MSSNHEWAPCHSLSVLLSTLLLGARVKPVVAGVAWPCLTSHHAAPALPTAPLGLFHCHSCHRCFLTWNCPHLPTSPPPGKSSHPSDGWFRVVSSGIFHAPDEVTSLRCPSSGTRNFSLLHMCSVSYFPQPGSFAREGTASGFALHLSHKLLSCQLGLGEAPSDRKLEIMVTSRKAHLLCLM